MSRSASDQNLETLNQFVKKFPDGFKTLGFFQERLSSLPESRGLDDRHLKRKLQLHFMEEALGLSPNAEDLYKGLGKTHSLPRASQLTALRDLYIKELKAA